MNVFIKHTFILFGTLFSFLPFSYAQNPFFDSLKNSLAAARHDTDKLRLLVQLSEVCEPNEILKYTKPAIELADKLLQYKPADPLRSHINNSKAAALNNTGFIYMNKGDFTLALDYYLKGLKIREETGDKQGVAESLNNVGYIYENQGNIVKALNYYEKSLKMREKIGDKYGIAISLNNMGLIYNKLGNIPGALDHFDKSLKMREQIGDKQGIGQSFSNIGTIYNKQGDNTKALDYYKKSLKIREEIGDKQGIAVSLNNIGLIYNMQGDMPQALVSWNKSLKIQEEIGDKQGIAYSLNNIGGAYRIQGYISRALDHYMRSLKIQKEIGDKQGIARSLYSIGGIYLEQNNISLALSYSDSSLTLSKELGFPENVRNAEQVLSKIDSAKGNYAGAFEHYKQFIIYRDSINNEETRKASIKAQLKYEYEKKEAVMQESQEKERAVAEGRNRFQQIVIWSVAGGLLLVVIFAAFVYRSLKITHKQKQVIEEKQREILDSIHYAKRIQNALMTHERYIQKNLIRLQKR